jgi:hypothetical protein
MPAEGPLLIMNEPDAQRMWKELGRSRRRQILSSIERGEQLSDRVDAELAVYLASRRRRSIWVLLVAPVVLSILVLTTRLATGGTLIAAVVSAVLGGLFLGMFSIPAWRKWSTVLARTEEVNREVAGDPPTDR